MKTLKKDLQQALAQVLPIVPKRAIVPIFACIHVEAFGGTLSLRATDGDQDVLEELDCEGDLDPVCVPAQKLAQLVDSAGTVIEFTLDGQRMKFSSEISGRPSHGIIATQNPAEFPPKTTYGAKAVGLNCADLGEGIKAVQFCASNDPGRPELNCVRVTANEREVVCDAAVGIVMARHTMSAIAAPASFIIPVAMTGRVAQSLHREESNLLLADIRIVVGHKRGSYSCKLAELNMPDMDRVMGAAREKIGMVNREQLIAHLRTCASLCPDGRVCEVWLDFGEAALEINFAVGDSYSGSIEGKFTPHQTAVNAKTFLPLLQAFDCDEVLLQYSPPMNNMLVLRDTTLDVASCIITRK